MILNYILILSCLSRGSYQYTYDKLLIIINLRFKTNFLEKIFILKKS